ncbi:MAG: hypothetical protein WA865_21555 [Spirulinaceae cyanobacterium]
MNTREELLSNLISTVCQQPKSSLPWRKAMNQLLQEVQQLPGLARSSHPDYQEALDDTLMRLATEIQEFKPAANAVEKSLVAWINYKLRLKYEVKNLNSSYRSRSKKSTKTAKVEYKEQVRKPPLSLDVPIGEQGNETFRDLIPTHEPSTIWEQQALIAEEQKKRQNSRTGIKLKTYIEQDPDSSLRNCHPRNYPHCNCLVLSQRLLLKYPPDKLVAIAKDLKINYHTLNWHWKNKGLPLLQAIALDLGYRK